MCYRLLSAVSTMCYKFLSALSLVCHRLLSVSVVCYRLLYRILWKLVVIATFLSLFFRISFLKILVSSLLATSNLRLLEFHSSRFFFFYFQLLACDSDKNICNMWRTFNFWFIEKRTFSICHGALCVRRNNRSLCHIFNVCHILTSPPDLYFMCLFQLDCTA